MQRASDAGSAAAELKRTVERFEVRLLRYAHHLLGDEDRAREVVQDTFLALVRADPLAVAGHEAQWLYAVCRNRAVDVLRKERPMDPIDDMTTRVSTETSPAAAAELSAAHDEVLVALAHLPLSQQEVVRLKFHGDLSYREISAITGLSESNVGYLIHVALKSLRGTLAPPDIQGDATTRNTT